MSVLGLHWRMRAFYSRGEWGPLSVSTQISVVVAHRLSCLAACGIFLDQGWNPPSSALVGGFLTTCATWEVQELVFTQGLVGG